MNLCFSNLEALKHSLSGFLEATYSHIFLTTSHNFRCIIIFAVMAAKIFLKVLICHHLCFLIDRIRSKVAEAALKRAHF